jgi:hypothetical protein
MRIADTQVSMTEPLLIPIRCESGGHNAAGGKAPRSAVSHCQPHSRRTRAGSADSAARDVSAACLASLLG